MTFKHSFLPSVELTSTTTEEGRFYHSPIGDLRSVTTILGDYLEKTALNEWIKAVGKEIANREAAMAANHGSIIHNLIEQYLRNGNPLKGIMPNNKILMKKIMPLLDAHVSTVFDIEFPLWSKYLRTAGRTDLICNWDRKLSIVDYKTSKEQISYTDCLERGHFLQTTAYSIMLEERQGMRASNIVIINIPEFEEPCFYVENRDKFIPEVIKIFTKKEM
jgi:Kyanoviridae exonuclease